MVLIVALARLSAHAARIHVKIVRHVTSTVKLIHTRARVSPVFREPIVKRPFAL